MLRQPPQKIPNFKHLCHMDRPISWPVSQLYKDVMTSSSVLQALYNAPVTEITLCCRHGENPQEYLILCIRSSDPNVLGGLGRVWARCERCTVVGGSYKSDAAQDTIKFSVDRPKLRDSGDNAIMECTYDNLRVEAMADLLKIIHDVSPRFVTASLNSWWFPVVAFAALRTLRSDWNIKPSKHHVLKAIDALSKSSSRGHSQEVIRVFSSHWHPGQGSTVPITALAAWGLVEERPKITTTAPHVRHAISPSHRHEEPRQQLAPTIPEPEPEPGPEQEHEVPLEPEPEADVEQEHQQEQEVESAPTAWTCTRFAYGDAVSSVQRLFTEPHDLEAVKGARGEEAELIMDMLQEALDDASDRLADANLRTRTVRLLQDISWHSDRLPQRIRLQQDVVEREYCDSGGEAVIWYAYLLSPPSPTTSPPPSSPSLTSAFAKPDSPAAKKVKVVVRDARPPEGKDWSSPAGKHILRLVRRQVIAHLQLSHPNILPLLGVTSTLDANGSTCESGIHGHPLSVVTPLADRGHALKYLGGMDRGERPVTFLKITIHIAAALHYLHTRQPPIIHGDIHARNIVINHNGTPLLCDFGLSRIQHEVTRTSTNIIEGGKYRYLAPELLFGPSSLHPDLPSPLYSDDSFEHALDDLAVSNSPSCTKFRTSVATDCYAFAMTILEMATLQRPFAEFENELAASRAAERGIRPRRPRAHSRSLPASPQDKGKDDGGFGDMPAVAADRLWELLGEMWHVDPLLRPGMDIVKERVEGVLCMVTSAASGCEGPPAPSSE